MDIENSLLTWSDNARAIDEIIARANKTLDLFDDDLRFQDWETRVRIDALKAAMHERGVKVRIALCRNNHLLAKLPRLMNLLKTHGHRLAILESEMPSKPEHFFAVADRQHCIFRPVLVQPRGFVFFENAEKSSIYSDNFKVIWEHGGPRVFPEAFGL
jgi:hypothetical protein